MLKGRSFMGKKVDTDFVAQLMGYRTGVPPLAAVPEP
jgi:hypothetical protein